MYSKYPRKEKYIIFSGIGNPESFKKTLVNNNFNIIKEIIFPDHYQYNSSEINNIKNLAKKLNAKIMTTEKDHVTLNPRISKGISFLEIELVLKKEKELINLIKTIL